jgi:hypothetical protein
MIYFLVTQRYSYTISWFLKGWASAQFLKKIKVIPYESLLVIKNIVPGAFIFSDLERLNITQLKTLEAFCDQVVAIDKNIPILNHPRNALTRYNLLKKLYDLGLNKFNVYPASAVNCNPHYPVFLRMNNDHDGPQSKLLKTKKQRDKIIRLATMLGAQAEHLLQVEFCETKSTDGYYRKYSAFRIGDQIIPGYLFFNNDWLVKDGKPPFKKYHELEKENYMRENPHENKIMEIFNIAAIKYGRIDYSMLNDSIQTWEINTNPTLIRPREAYRNRKELIPTKKQLAKSLESSFMSISYDGEVPIPVDAQQSISFKWDRGKYFKKKNFYKKLWNWYQSNLLL